MGNAEAISFVEPMAPRSDDQEVDLSGNCSEQRKGRWVGSRFPTGGDGCT